MTDQFQQKSISFIPERLNRQPTVYRGLTFSELLIVISGGAMIGALVGILIMLFFGADWYVIFMGMLAFGWLSLRFGGFYISRLKRGKPDTWLERYVEFKRSPSKFITQNTYWSIKRTSKKGHL
ncbi:TIGR03750 family conjugal transfer protein [[Pasteurella] aerogenes]